MNNTQLLNIQSLTHNRSWIANTYTIYQTLIYNNSYKSRPRECNINPRHIKLTLSILHDIFQNINIKMILFNRFFYKSYIIKYLQCVVFDINYDICLPFAPCPSQIIYIPYENIIESWLMLCLSPFKVLPNA